MATTTNNDDNDVIEPDFQFNDPEPDADWDLNW